MHILVAPVAVPSVCNKFTPANIELLWDKQIFNPSIIYSVDGSFVSRIFKNDATAAKPLTLSILGYMFTMANETKI